MAENPLAMSVEVRSLAGGYGSHGGSHGGGTDVLKGLSFSIRPGSFTAIAGPNGAGKSTILKYIIRELKCSPNSIYLAGKDITELKQKEVARLVSFQGQYSERTSEFTVAEAVAFGRYAHDDIYSNNQAVSQALETVGILHLRDKLITRISGGEFQLAMLARTICQDSPVMALDEPANNLDPRHQLRLMNMLSSLSSQGRTIICVLHDLNAILRYCTHCILIQDGKIHSQGPVSDVLTESNIRDVYGIGCHFAESQGTRFVIFD